MKVSQADTKDTRNLQITSPQVSEECIQTCDANFKDIIKSSTASSENNSLRGGISGEYTLGIEPSDLKTLFNYDTLTMDRDDAMFFIDMINLGQFSLNIKGDAIASVMQLDSAAEITTYKSVNVSKTLVNLIDNAYTAQKPVRIDFDNNVSVILKVTKDGKLNAEFIPGDKAVEQYLKNNIAFLKQRFDEQELSYEELTYRPYKQQKQKNNENKGEQN